MKEEQALSEIGRLSRELTAAKSALKQAERALEAFAREADEWGVTWSDAHRPEQDEARATFTVGDLRRARQALSSIRQTGGVE